MESLSIEQHAIRAMLARVSTPHLGDRTSVAIILRGARATGLYKFALREAAKARAGWLAWVTNTQREWKTRASRRPARCFCKAYDGDAITRRTDLEKWATRENYVRASGRDVRLDSRTVSTSEARHAYALALAA